MLKRRPLHGLVSLLSSLALCLVLVPSITAQDATSPEPTTVILERSLSEPGHASVTPCSTGRNPGTFDESGLTVTLNGSCWSMDNGSSQIVHFPEVGLQDGEIRFDLRVTRGYDQFALMILTRMPLLPPHTMSSQLRMSTVFLDMAHDMGTVSIGDAEGVKRSGLRQAIPQDTWTTVAVQLQGPAVNLLIDGQPFLAFSDVAPSSGFAGRDLIVGGMRFERAEASEDAVFTLRNLRVTERLGAGGSPTPSVPNLRDLLDPPVQR